jgi:regulator of protease activity HflC (stomatin/prohibitin superfamily)
MEKKALSLSGYIAVVVGLVVMAGLTLVAIWGAMAAVAVVLIGALVLGGLFLALWVNGFVIVNPNQAKVLQLFGAYAGTVRQAGFSWVNPLTTKRTVSLRIRNFESSVLKVNDLDGNPIEIGAVVVWQVRDAAEAVFQVDAYEQFVVTQAEAAVRHLATSYPYDAHTDGVPSLRSGLDVAEELRTEIQERVSRAGVEVLEARITHLAYAPEIAQAMLQRQQASAVVAARSKIVEGAVGMVQMALDRLAEMEVVELDEERKAAMVSNLLVVLCGDRSTQPVVNAGSLYH